LARGICRECKYTAVCLPSAEPQVFTMVFEKAALKLGLPSHISRFELMMLRGAGGYLPMLERAYHMTADKVPCERPYIRVDTKWDADILRVFLRFSKNRRIGFRGVSELHVFQDKFRET